ncbi:hypothetical protein [Nocardia araoensis]|uniref:hypothetical protein n=1 Tax=Nocardia araoensis TaxID=228600 RepID=UPI0002E92835|nr:hypothetical protein [Nocardia araoensis]
MSAPSPGTSTRFRLARIAGLVLGSLLFLHACERSKSALLSDVRVEVAIAAAFGAAALVAAWFEIKLRALEDADPPWDDAEEAETPSPGNFPGRAGRSGTPGYGRGERAGRTGIGARSAPMAHSEDDDLPDPVESSGPVDLVAGIARTLRITRDERQPLLPLGAVTKWLRRVDPDDDIDPGELDDHDETEQITRTETGELVIESGARTVRAKISRSGDLVLHGRRHGAARSEWKWTFTPDAFPAIRGALGDEPGDLLDLLEDTLPWLDTAARHDPGAWLRAHDIPATYQEKGVSATQDTRELPILRPGRPPQPPHANRSHRKPPRDESRAGAVRAAAASDDRARSEARRERPAATRSRDSAVNDDSRATKRRPDTSPPSRRGDADRPTHGDQFGPHPSDDHGWPTRSRRHRDEPQPGRRGNRSPRTDPADPHPTPGRPDLPRRRHGDDERATRHATGRPDDHDDAETLRPRANRQSGRGQDPGAFESRAGRRERPDTSYRDRPTPSDRAAEPPSRRRGDQPARRDTAFPSHESSRRGW